MCVSVCAVCACACVSMCMFASVYMCDVCKYTHVLPGMYKNYVRVVSKCVLCVMHMSAEGPAEFKGRGGVRGHLIWLGLQARLCGI